MAAVCAEESLSGLEPPIAEPPVPLEINMSRLREIALKLGMDPDPINDLQKPDIGYLQEMAQLPIDLAETPAGTDIPGMRRWVQELFTSEVYAKEKARFKVRRRRPVAEVGRSIVSVPCSDGSDECFNLWIYEPQNEEASPRPKSRPAILMLHGGGWIHGTPIGDELFAEIFASELGAVVIGVDYRLAPEHPFPAPLEDCVQALDWLYKNAEQYQVDITRIGLWGASAGGNLAAACALKYDAAAHSTDQCTIRLVSLVVPATAHPKAEALFDQQRVSTKSCNEELFANVPPFPESVSREIATLYELYIGDKTDPCDPFASPLASNPTPEHPATLITIAACDFLRPQGLKYAQLLRSSNVQVDEDVLRGVPHGFTFALNADMVKSWFERQIDAFASAFDVADAL
ncbi:hypothetical protein LTR46_004808 [Exophiala xenobiotica]|uniref:Alpha/beta hydrolase fold-3 domain-containing protein n=1 Tax=Vermiconidia calcicola TaxID=1690605 RepID=A0AAV9QM68_9PEZI|nr:hypothetical protein LTR18_004203 [Exophiala xenobiotica]KAK5545084.1 hypothetical protein LTR25_000091 [Vermiconidia calcicola]KAK5556997.1 hypothetical protein LTR46_004808 [Exophiala xenobiotica]